MLDVMIDRESFPRGRDAMRDAETETKAAENGIRGTRRRRRGRVGADGGRARGGGGGCEAEGVVQFVDETRWGGDGALEGASEDVEECVGVDARERRRFLKKQSDARRRRIIESGRGLTTVFARCR
jgi:hypothetical protein